MNRIHLFGGKLRTGDAMEYIITFSLLAISLMVFNPMKQYLLNDNNKPLKFNVYYINYKDLYERNIIDEKTYFEKRFKLF